ncbi:MAG: trehalose-phosphatase [Candidatus Omnitrophota bacterium]
MKYFFDEWDALKEMLKKDRIFLFLDFDGTLTPIADTPGQAVLPKKTKELLKALSGNGQFRVAIVSGRALDDVREKVGLDGLIYVGNHGLEVYDSRLRSRWMMPPRVKKMFAEIRDRLNETFAETEGVLIEDKEFTISLHYRLAHLEDAVINGMFDKATSPYRAEGKIDIVAGKKVFEVLPAGVGRKGKAVVDIFLQEHPAANHMSAIPVYIGDDETDETAFEETNDKKGITIRVGAGNRTAASYYVNDTEEVVKLLGMILKIKKGVSDADPGKS